MAHPVRKEPALPEEVLSEPRCHHKAVADQAPAEGHRTVHIPDGNQGAGGSHYSSQNAISAFHNLYTTSIHYVSWDKFLAASL